MKPKSVAVVGASQRASRGTRVITNLRRFGYGGRIFPINPKYPEIAGLPCYPDLASTPEPADTVVVAIPAEHVPGVLTAAADSGVRGAVVLSSGFGEAGAAGRERQAALERLARDRGLLICGPNCYGVFNLRLGSATYSADVAEPVQAGAVAVVSQSGGFSHWIAEHLMRQRRIGLSYVVSCGNQAGVTVEDYLDFLVADEDTAVIGAVVEAFRQPAKLRELTARAAHARKPIVVLKVGRSEGGRQATLAHTGSLAGPPEIVDAALKQYGVVQVTTLNEMLDTLAVMSAARAYRRPGGRVVVLSGLGGECGHVADVADRVGVELPPLSPASAEALRRFMPGFANPRNPLDGTGAMYEDSTLFPRILDVLVHDEDHDVVAINLRATVPQPGAWSASRQFSQAMREALGTGTDRLVLAFASFAGGDLDPDVVTALADVNVPFLEGTETTMYALRHLIEHRRFLDRRAQRRPAGASARAGAGGASERAFVEIAAASAHGVLANAEAMRLLRAFGIPLVETLPAADADAAVSAAERLGYPVALKIDSVDVAHKTDVGGVRLGCADADAVRAAFRQIRADVGRRAPSARVDGVLVQPMVGGGTEMILGVKCDPGFGSVILCGFGGIFVEVMRDVALRVPPVEVAEAYAMLADLRGRALLDGARGRPPADVAALAETLVKLGTLAEASGPRLKALDVNPLLVLERGRGVVAIDWLVELA